MKINREYLESLSYEELLELYRKYDRMGKDILRFNIESGIEVLHDADIIDAEIKSREHIINNSKKKIKK